MLISFGKCREFLAAALLVQEDMSADVAVIIPTYNRAALLKRAIDSVQVQTCAAHEIIVVDDGSQDDTDSVVQRYTNCRYAKIEHSGLPAVARNVGVRMAEATYVAFLDSDDEWLPYKLEKQRQIIAEASCGLVCSNATLVSEDNRAGKRPYLPPGQKHAGSVLKDLLADNFVITSSVVVRRELLKPAGGFSEDPLLCGLEDYDLWLRLAAAIDFFYIDEELLFYKHANTSLSRSRSSISYWQGMERIFSRAAHRTLVNRQYREFCIAARKCVLGKILSSGFNGLRGFQSVKSE